MTIGVDAIIDRLGGAEAAARLTGVGNRGGAQVAPGRVDSRRATGRR